jgi:hypothetical protein
VPTVDEPKKDYGIGMGLALLIWAAILAYLPSYLGFTNHWTAYIAYALSGIAGLIGAIGTIYEVFKQWPFKLASFNENLAVSLFLAGLAVVAHLLGTAVPWLWLATVMRVAAVVIAAAAAIGFGFSTEDAIRATLTGSNATTRRKVWNAIKAVLAFVVGLLSAAAAILELSRALR